MCVCVCGGVTGDLIRSSQPSVFLHLIQLTPLSPASPVTAENEMEMCILVLIGAITGALITPVSRSSGWGGVGVLRLRGES